MYDRYVGHTSKYNAVILTKNVSQYNSIQSITTAKHDTKQITINYNTIKQSVIQLNSKYKTIQYIHCRTNEYYIVQ